MLDKIEKGLRLGLAITKLTKIQVDKVLKPLLKSGDLTKKEYARLQKKLLGLAKTEQRKFESYVKSRVDKELKKRGYVKKKAAKKNARRKTSKKRAKKKTSRKKTTKRKAKRKKTAKRKVRKKKAKKRRL